MRCRVVPFVPGWRPTDEGIGRGLGSSDRVALLTGDDRRHNCAVVLFEVAELPAGATVHATITVDGQAVRGWERRPLALDEHRLQRLELHPELDLAEVDLGFAAGFLRTAVVQVQVDDGGDLVAGDEVALDVCAVGHLGTLYDRLVDRLVVPDTARQADAAGVADPGVRYHPWYPVLTIGGDKAALYTDALVADIVAKEQHFTDPAWLLRVGVYLELLTAIGIVEAVRPDVGDLLDPHERHALDHGDALAEVRRRIDPRRWREVWRQRQICFPRIGHPRLGPVSALNLVRKRNATLRFLHAHHADLKQAIELAGPNHVNSQETWQRVFRDAERAVMRMVGEAFPELGFLPAPAREIVLWERIGFAGRQGLYHTASNQYRASMNSVAEWAKARGLMDHAGGECVPVGSSLIAALDRDPPRVAVLQRQDGLGPDLTVAEPVSATEPTFEAVEQLLAAVPIFQMLSAADLHTLTFATRPLFLGPTQRFVIEGNDDTSLFLVGDGEVEVWLRRPDGTDWMVETIGRGEVVGEMALLTGQRRAATVRSVEESVVFEISREGYAPLLNAHPEWVEELAAVMEQRLTRRRTRMAELDRASTHSLLSRIRHNFFGGLTTGTP